jgi:hypothetical protein
LIATPYVLPFAFEAPIDNPWDGRDTVEICVNAATHLDFDHAERLREHLSPFWLLAAAGGLAGSAVEPWLSTCKEPFVDLQQGVGTLRFDQCVLDERASHCLLCLLLVVHEEIALQRVTISAPNSARHAVAFDAKLEDPYPGLWPRLPFTHEVEDSESETRVLRVQFASSLTEKQVGAVHEELRHWGVAAAAGAFGGAPIPPRSGGCLLTDAVEHYEGELIWPIEKCRFHEAALRSLVAVCATIHHRVAKILEVVVE